MHETNKENKDQREREREGESVCVERMVPQQNSHEPRGE